VQFARKRKWEYKRVFASDEWFLHDKVFINFNKRGNVPEKISEPQPPRGLARLAFRTPIWLYRLHLGWLLGKRFVHLTHTGRKSGLPRQVVLEVVDHDPQSNVYYVASGWGKKSDWYQNIQKTPRVRVQVGAKSWAAQAEVLAPDSAEQVILNYGRKHPALLGELARVMGYKLNGSEADMRALGRLVPVVAFTPVKS
jgi:deazaflavin-dependent oxidoreductase (nitroreductase family)